MKIMETGDRPAHFSSWNNEQLVSWLSGISHCASLYTDAVVNAGLTGKWLCRADSSDLASLGILKVGHKLIILEKINQLNLQYTALDTETFSSLLFKIITASANVISAINRALKLNETKNCSAESGFQCHVSEDDDYFTAVFSCILRLDALVIELVLWIDRPPFSQIADLAILRRLILEKTSWTSSAAKETLKSYSIEQLSPIRDEVAQIRSRVESVLHECTDSLILTPCGFEVVQIRKANAEADFGFNFRSTFNSVHVIVFVRNDSPASQTEKISKGDQVIEVNGQIVIGWDHAKVAELMRSDHTLISLRLRKRPQHSVEYLGSVRRPGFVSQPNPPANKLVMRKNPASRMADDRTDPPLSNGTISLPVTPIMSTRGYGKANSAEKQSPHSTSESKCQSRSPDLLDEDQDRRQAAAVLSSCSLNLSGGTAYSTRSLLEAAGLRGKKSNRRISCRDLGQGDCQGWLLLKKSNSFTTKYVKRWCVFKHNTLYYYRNPEDGYAEGLIILNGFTISPRPEVKHGRYAFRVYNDWVRFVFASESEQDRSKWMNKLGLAAIGLSSDVRFAQIGGFHPGYTGRQAGTTNIAVQPEDLDLSQGLAPTDIVNESASATLIPSLLINEKALAADEEELVAAIRFGALGSAGHPPSPAECPQRRNSESLADLDSQKSPGADLSRRRSSMVGAETRLAVYYSESDGESLEGDSTAREDQDAASTASSLEDAEETGSCILAKSRSETITQSPDSVTGESKRSESSDYESPQDEQKTLTASAPAPCSTKRFVAHRSLSHSNRQGQQLRAARLRVRLPGADDQEVEHHRNK